MNDCYLVFAGSQYYPLGGWDDFIAMCSTLESAMANTASERHMAKHQLWLQVVEIKDGVASTVYRYPKI